MNDNKNGADLVRLRHPEWSEHQTRWRWLLDSLEGGERYRSAVYGYDGRGLPVRKLARHKREYPDPRETAGGTLDFASAANGSTGAEQVATATDDDYELRRARTPIPTFVAEAVETHLSRIFSREVKRSGPPRLTEWWRDVDGRGASIDQWISETVAPLLLVLGQIDICIDHPPAPEDETIETKADVQRLGLDRSIASCILPENMLWWKLDSTESRYVECLTREFHESDEERVTRYRHWTESASTLYSEEGKCLSITPHPYGRVPIVRLFDRKKPRCKNIGQSRYEGIAERQREYYNRDSELILSDTTQAHPLLQGPEDFVQADGTIPIGPSWLLPKKKNTLGGAATYEGFDIIEFPKDGAESLRKNKADIRDDVDRDSSLVRGSCRKTVAQSGLSKAMDHIDGNNRLAKIAKVLARAETTVAELTMTVMCEGAPVTSELREIEVVYPSEFDLFTAGDLARTTGEFQSLAANAGTLPYIEGLMLARLARLCLPGLVDEQYARCDQEIAEHLASKNARSKPST